jgi:NADP-dependent 3-hydroxy acid dehydrogenase YdfG
MFVLQDVNFWGTVHPTHAALPHLKKSGGKIFVNSSVAGMLAMPRMSFYNVHFPPLSSAQIYACDF